MNSKICDELTNTLGCCTIAKLEIIKCSDQRFPKQVPTNITIKIWLDKILK